MDNFGIFTNISPDAQKRMSSCLLAREISFETDEMILSYNNSFKKTGILLDGYARLYYSDADGNQSVMEELTKGSVFGDPFLSPAGLQNYYIRACEPSKVLFIDYERMLKCCENVCSHHIQLINNLFKLSAQKCQTQIDRINILTRPSVRQKLLTYFDIICKQNVNDAFIVPMSYTELADYLCIERSSMMRELKKLCDDEIIKRSGREIKIIK